MNKTFIIKTIDLVIVLALILVYQGAATGRAEAEKEAYAEAQAAMREQQAQSGAHIYKDGTFSGSAQGYGGPVTVEVTIADDVITDINPVSHSGEGDAYWAMASGMIPEMISRQTPDVDTVTGATFSSTGLHNAVVIALQEALQ